MPVFVPLDRVLDSPFQTRSHYDPEAVVELADSIERDGQLQTPVGRVLNGIGAVVPAEKAGAIDWDSVRLGAQSGFTVQLAYGHTRARAWRAIWDRRGEDLVARADGVHGCPPGCMPVELRPMTDDAMERLAWEENERRRDLDPVDRARAIYDRGVRHNWTHAEAAEALGLDRTTISNILRWFQTFHEGPFRGVGHWVLARMRRGEVSESKARALVKAFQVAADNREAYRSVWNRLTSLSALAAAAVEYDSAADLRDEVEAFVAEVETRALTLRRQREPAMFDDAVLDKDEQDAPPAPEIARDEPETADPVLDQEDGYDDGGAGLKRAAEALGKEPFDQGERRTRLPEDYPGDCGPLADVAPEAAGLSETAGEGAPWPRPVLPEEWAHVDGMTIKQLEETRARYALHGFVRLDKHHVGEDRRKPAQQVHTRAVLRAVANLRAAVQLTDGQLDEVLDHLGDTWMRWSTSPANGRLREVAPMPDAHWRRHLRAMVLPTLVKKYDEIARAMGKLPATPTDVSADTPPPEEPAAPADAGDGVDAGCNAGGAGSEEGDDVRVAARGSQPSGGAGSRAAVVLPVETEPTGAAGTGDGAPVPSDVATTSHGEPEAGEADPFDRLVAGDAELAATMTSAELAAAFNRAADAHLVKPVRDRIWRWIEEAETREAARAGGPAEAEPPALSPSSERTDSGTGGPAAGEPKGVPGQDSPDTPPRALGADEPAPEVAAA